MLYIYIRVCTYFVIYVEKEYVKGAIFIKYLTIILHLSSKNVYEIFDHTTISQKKQKYMFGL